MPGSAPPFALEGLDHVVLLVDDMASARGFYTEVIGCTVEGALPQYGMLQLRAGAALIDLVDISGAEGEWGRPPVAGGRNMDHVCIATGPCDEQAMRAHLAHHGVAIVEEGIRYGANGAEDTVHVWAERRGRAVHVASLTEPPRSVTGPLPPAVDDIAVDGGRIEVTWTRYAGGDPNCCPSQLTTVTYELDGGTLDRVGKPVTRSAA